MVLKSKSKSMINLKDIFAIVINLIVYFFILTISNVLVALLVGTSTTALATTIYFKIAFLILYVIAFFYSCRYRFNCSNANFFKILAITISMIVLLTYLKVFPSIFEA